MLLLTLVFLATNLIHQQSVPRPALEALPSARLAAVQFAIANGWHLPKTNLVVALDTTLGAVDGRPIKISDEQQAAEASAIARLLGSEVKTGWATDYLDCPSRGVCFPKSTPVLVVNGLFEGENDILVRLYIPAEAPGQPIALTSAIIDVETRDTGWTGVRYRQAPETLRRIR